jgi:hypothetical protein
MNVSRVPTLLLIWEGQLPHGNQAHWARTQRGIPAVVRSLRAKIEICDLQFVGFVSVFSGIEYSPSIFASPPFSFSVAM